MTDSEIDVVRHLLPKDDWRSNALLAQAIGCLGVERKQHGLAAATLVIPGFPALPPQVNVTSLCESPWIVVTLISGRQARFRINVDRSGLLGPLTGEMLDGGPWVKWFEVDPRSFPSDPPENWFTPRMDLHQRARILERLEQWAGSEAGTLTKLDEATLWVSPPATDIEIAQVEAANKAHLPEVYKSLLKITNGLRHTADDFGVYDTPNLETLDLTTEGSTHWRFYEHYQLGIFTIGVGPDSTAVTRIDTTGDMEDWLPFHKFVSRILAGMNHEQMYELNEQGRP